jgi:Fe-S-cluster containining protein
MASCNGCGACCDPVVTVHSPQAIRLGYEIRADGSIGDRIDADELAFMRKHTRPLARREGIALAGRWGVGVYSEFMVGNQMVLLPAFYYTCDRYDPEARQCTDYENRPDMCRDFPWYGAPPDPLKALPVTCSYREDIGEPVVPIEVAVAAPTCRT